MQLNKEKQHPMCHKIIFPILLFTLAIPTGYAASEKVYESPLVDSIVSAEISHQLSAEQIDLKIERSANEKFAWSLAEQNKRLAEHDHEMSTRFSWIGILFWVNGQKVGLNCCSTYNNQSVAAFKGYE